MSSLPFCRYIYIVKFTQLSGQYGVDPILSMVGIWARRQNFSFSPSECTATSCDWLCKYKKDPEVLFGLATSRDTLNFLTFGYFCGLFVNTYFLLYKILVPKHSHFYYTAVLKIFCFKVYHKIITEIQNVRSYSAYHGE